MFGDRGAPGPHIWEAPNGMAADRGPESGAMESYARSPNPLAMIMPRRPLITASSFAYGPQSWLRRPLGIVAPDIPNETPKAVPAEDDSAKVRVEFGSGAVSGNLQVKLESGSNGIPIGSDQLKALQNAAVGRLNGFKSKVEASLVRGNIPVDLLEGLKVAVELDTVKVGVNGSKFSTDLVSATMKLQGDVARFICDEHDPRLKAWLEGEVKFALRGDMAAKLLASSTSMFETSALVAGATALVDRFGWVMENRAVRIGFRVAQRIPTVFLIMTMIELGVFISELNKFHYANAYAAQIPPGAMELTTQVAGEASTSTGGTVGATQALIDRGQIPEAAAQFARRSRAEATAQPHITLARAAIADKLGKVAMDEADRAIEKAPNSSRAWNTKGRAEISGKKVRRQDYEAAIESFNKAIELDPENVWALNNLGYAELMVGNYRDAYQHLKRATAKATRRNVATGYMFNNFGLACEHLDLLDDAREAFEQGRQRGSLYAANSLARLEGVKTVRRTARPLPATVMPLHRDDHDNEPPKIGDVSQQRTEDRVCDGKPERGESQHATASGPVNGERALETAEKAQAGVAEQTKNSSDVFSIMRGWFSSPPQTSSQTSPRSASQLAYSDEPVNGESALETAQAAQLRAEQQKAGDTSNIFVAFARASFR